MPFLTIAPGEAGFWQLMMDRLPFPVLFILDSLGREEHIDLFQAPAFRFLGGNGRCELINRLKEKGR
jgi:hypothetical protein